MKYTLINIIFWGIILPAISQGKNIIITELSDVNTSFNEIAPYVYQNKLIYCSDVKKEGFKEIFKTYTTSEGKTLTDYYAVPSVGGQRYKNPQRYAEELLTPHFEGPFTFDIERDRMFFSRNIFSNERGNSLKDGNNMMIYYSTINRSGEFRPPAEARFINSNKQYNYMCPSVNPEGTLFFFCSNQPGGYGGYDIYVCEGTRGRFRNPQNLGNKVNTSGDEIYPFAHISGRLYFSSNETHEGGRGRFNVYYTYFYENEWATPINAGDPFNSNRDDYGVYISDDLKSGFFSSNRKRGSFDIYYFEIKYPIFEECKEMEENYFCYRFDDPSGVDLDTVAFMYEWDLGDGTKIRSASVEHCYAEPGMYFVQLNVIDEVTGEIKTNQANYMLELKDIEQVNINSVDTVYVNEEIVFDGLETNIRDFEIDEFYWFMGDGSDVKRGLNVSHKYEKEGEYIVKLGITSTMDERKQINKACGSKRIVVLKH